MECLLKAEHISKFDKDIAIIQDVSLELYPGQVTCVLGENGAGKSMLVKILSGYESFDKGNLMIKGHKVHYYSAGNAHRAGVRLLAQERNLFEGLSVMDNLCLNNAQLEQMLSFNPAELRRQCMLMLERVHLQIDLDTMVRSIHLREQKLIELARFFSYDADIMIFDEPAAPLYEPDIDLLYRLIAEERAKGKCIVLVSHNISDVNRIADRIIVMRNGKVCQDCPNDAKLDMDMVLSSVKGKLYLNRYPKTKTELGEEILRVEHLSDQQQTVSDVSFSMRTGEIVGIAGIEGAGKTNLTRLLFGSRAKKSGKIYIDGKETPVNSPRDAIDAGVAYVSNYAPSDLFSQQNVDYNLNALLWSTSALRIPSDQQLQENARELMVRFKIKVSDISMPLSHVSMGNQQKVSLARWFCRGSRLFIMDDPTKSLDISSKVDLYNILDHITKKQCSVLLASSDLNELICMCDRILVMKQGRITHNIVVKESEPEKIVDLIFPNWCEYCTQPHCYSEERKCSLHACRSL